jgi:(4S)-4-hydroxy-5-phosphonooxypentane-2,3-dione isomerase
LTCEVMDFRSRTSELADQMPVTYIIKFQVVPERRGEFLGLLDGVLDAMRDEPPFHEAVLHRDPTGENRFMLYETWEDHEDVLNVQLHRSYRQTWHEALPHLLEVERDITIWEPIRSDRNEVLRRPSLNRG